MARFNSRLTVDQHPCVVNKLPERSKSDEKKKKHYKERLSTWGIAALETLLEKTFPGADGRICPHLSVKVQLKVVTYNPIGVPIAFSVGVH